MTLKDIPHDDPLVLRASDIVDEKTNWLWDGRVPFATLSRIDGDPGLGKSLLTVDLAARASTGRAMPGDRCVGSDIIDLSPINTMKSSAGTVVESPISVLMLAAEDHPGTVRRRLAAAGADLDRLHLVVSDSVSFPKSAPWLEREIERTGAKLVVIDPLMSFLDHALSANQDQDVRRALRPLTGIAERTGAAVLLVGHLNKSGGTSAVYRSVGSIGLLASVRVAMLVAKDRKDEDLRVLAVSKSNLGHRPLGELFEITETGAQEPVISWLGPTAASADSLVAPPEYVPHDKGTQAKAMLLELLSDADLPQRQVQEEAGRRRIGWTTVSKAKQDLGIRSVARPIAGVKGPGEYVWVLPDRQRSVTPPPILETTDLIRDALDRRLGRSTGPNQEAHDEEISCPAPHTNR